ncbi:hypothetical protein LSCM4_03579 [Leishmania orientalis]|uniref:Uncharacterized protein n=1 Tax=Leishmania orientalis TaxID=2249476 RepID=A0A836KK34_9TRYP|nr:hypothetical protein LSCM4_03579 [Leishmania orientalis]
MPSTYAHEPNLCALEAITRYVSALQRSEVQSCAALFANTYDGLRDNSFCSHARVRGEREPVHLPSSAREPPPSTRRATTMRRNGWPAAERPASVFEASPLPPPLSRHVAQLESSAFLTSAEMVEEDVRVEEYAVGWGSGLCATDMRHREACHTPSAQSRAHGSFGSSQEGKGSVKVRTDARIIHPPCFYTCGPSRSASLGSSPGASERGVLDSSTAVYRQQRQRPPPPQSWLPSEAAGATPRPNSHSLRLDVSADISRKSNRARENRHFAFSLNVSKADDTPRISRATPIFAADGVCNARGLNLEQASSQGHSSHPPLQGKPGSRERNGGSRLARWMMQQEAGVPLASPMPKPVLTCTSASSVSSSRSPPSVTVAVARHARSVASCDTEALSLSVQSSGAYSLPQDSRASVSSCSSCFMSCVERGGRHSTGGTTTMRRRSYKHDAGTRVDVSDGTKAPSHTTPAVAVAATAGHLAHGTKQHLSDALQGSSPPPRDPLQKEAARLRLPSSVAALPHVSSSLQQVGSGAHSIHISTVGPTRTTPPRLARAPRNPAKSRLASATSSLRRQRHVADRATSAFDEGLVWASLNRVQCATGAASETSSLAGRASSQSDTSTASGLERYTLPVESVPLRSTSVVAFAANEASLAPFTGCSLRPSLPSAAATVVTDRAREMSVCPSQRQARAHASANARHRDASEASVASPSTPTPASAHVATSPKADSSLAEAATMLPDVLSGPAGASTRAARRQCSPLPSLLSPSLESSPVTVVQPTSDLPQRSLSLHSTCGAGPASEKHEDGPPAPPARTESSPRSPPRRGVSPLQGATKVLDVAEKTALSLVSAVTGTCDTARLVQSTAEVERRAPGDRAGRLEQGEEILSHAVGRRYVALRWEAIDTAGEPLAGVSEMQGDVAREEFTCTNSDTSDSFFRESSEEQQDLQQHPQQQVWHRYLTYVSPVRAPGASPLNQVVVGATTARCGQAGVPLSTPLTVFSTKRSPPLAHPGHRRRREGCLDGGHPSAQSPANDARPEAREGHDWSGSGCPHCSAAASKEEREEATRVEATAVTAEVPGQPWQPPSMPSLAEAKGGERDITNEGFAAAAHWSRRDPPSLVDIPLVTASFPATWDGAVRLKSPALSHAGVALLRKRDEGSGSHLSGGGEFHDRHSGSEGFGCDSPRISTEAHLPRRHRGGNGPVADNSVTPALTLSHTQLESLNIVASDFDWVSDDYAAQPRPHRTADGEEPLTVPSPVDIAKFGSSPALTAGAVCEVSLRSGGGLESQTSAAPRLACGADATENSNHIDPLRQTRHADSSPSHLALPLCALSNLGPLHQSNIWVLGSSPTSSTGSPSMDSFVSLEHTPPTQSITNAAAMESSVTEYDAPVTSSFFACDHSGDAALAAAAARKAAKMCDVDVASDVRATEGPALWADEQVEAIAGEDDDDLPCSPGEGLSSPGFRSSDPPSRATQPAVRAPGDVSAETADAIPLTSSATKSVVAASSHTSRLGSDLHSNSVFNMARCAPTSHAASTATNGRTVSTNRSSSTNRGTSEGLDRSNGDRVDDRLGDVPTLRDRYAPYPAPVLGADGFDVYSSVSSASAPPPPPGPPRESPPQPHQQRMTFLLTSSSTRLSDAEGTVTALQSKASGQETGASRAEAGEGAQRGVARESNSSLLSTHAASQARAPSQLSRGRCSGERQKEKHETDISLQTSHSQPLQQWQQSKQVQDDGDSRPKTSHRALSSGFSAGGSYFCGGSVNLKPYGANGSHGGGIMENGDEGEPGAVVDTGGGAGEDRGEPIALVPSLVQSSEGSRGSSASTRYAAGEACGGRPSSLAYPSIGATAPTTAAKTPGYRRPALRQRMRTSMRVVLSKPPVNSGANRLWLANGVHRSRASSLRDDDSVAAAREAGNCLRRQQATAWAEDNDACVAVANDFGIEDEEDGGYCSYGYESDSIQV